MSRTRRLAALATGAALLLSACSSARATDAAPTASPAAGKLTPVTVVLDWTPNTNHSGLYLALANGWYKDAGLDVKVVEPGDTSGLQLLAAGQADFAYSVAEELLPARAAGADVVSVATVIEHNTSSLLSLTSAGITRPRDLRGQEVRLLRLRPRKGHHLEPRQVRRRRPFEGEVRAARERRLPHRAHAEPVRRRMGVRCMGHDPSARRGRLWTCPRSPSATGSTASPTGTRR